LFQGKELLQRKSVFLFVLGILNFRQFDKATSMELPSEDLMGIAVYVMRSYNWQFDVKP